MKNTMEKPVFDKKRMGDMFEEMFASLGDGDTAGHGTFRKKFIKVWGGGDLSSMHSSTVKQKHHTAQCESYGAVRSEIHIWFLVFSDFLVPVIVSLNDNNSDSFFRFFTTSTSGKKVHNFTQSHLLSLNCQRNFYFVRFKRFVSIRGAQINGNDFNVYC